MTPAARLQSAIELLAQIAETERPADASVSAYFRDRRYIGSKDRHAVAEAVYRVLRRHARLRWWLERVSHPPTPRALVVADVILGEGTETDVVAGLFGGGQFGPEPMSDTERRLARMLAGQKLEHPDMPEAVRIECPHWAEPGLRRSLGERFAPELAAMLGPAPLDLRVNPIKADRNSVLAQLKADGIEARASALSPYGVRVSGRPNIAIHPLFKDGAIEIQDEASQLVALVADARPGHQVVDFCAGAGGKTLAIAATMENKGRIVACDVLEGRLRRAKERLRRAGVHNVETRPLASENDKWVKRHKGAFDRVLVDAPCSGTGTWRRNPDMRWRQLGPAVDELTALQSRLLDSGARLVRPGGRLVYATCSLLPQENESQAESFLARSPEFRRARLAEIWEETIVARGGGAFPDPGPHLKLTPARNHTDGFFASIFERVAE